LNVEGTDRADRIQVVPTRNAGVVRVIANGKQLGNHGPVSWIDVAAGAGNDSVIIDARITLPARLDGGLGHDTLRGGSGPNAVLGGPGNDTLVVTRERDTYDGGPGRTRTVAQRGLGVIQVGPSAAGPGLRRLAGSHRFSSLSVAGPAIVGPADLRNPRIVELLKESHHGGHTVALAGGTEAEANALARLLGDPRPVDLPDDVGRADLVAFRKTSGGGPAAYEVSVLLPMLRKAPAPLAAMATRAADRAYLGRVFSPVHRVPGRSALGDSSDDLTNLAAAYLSSVSYNDPENGTTQIFTTVYSARSFAQQADFYYVAQEVQSTNFNGTMGQVDTGANPRGVTPRVGPKAWPELIQPTPMPNPQAVSYTTGVSESFGVSVGWNEDSGYNASVNAGVSLEASQTYTIPPLQIEYEPNLLAGEPLWFFLSNQGTLDQLTVNDSWIWVVAFDKYETGQTQFNFDSYAVVGPLQGAPVYTAQDMASAPLPFGDIFQLQAPVVTGVSPSAVSPGAKFTVTGSAFYPSLVESVVLDGQALDPSSYTVVSDTQIEVVAPNSPGSALPIVVKTTQGLSNANVTIDIAGASQVDVKALPIAAVAGQAFTNLSLATVTDSDTNANPAGFTASIDWGDGATSAGTLTATGPGTFNLTGGHAYASAGTYTFRVEVTDPNGIKGTANGTATVSPPSTAGGPQNLVAQPVSTVAGRAFTNATIATFTDSDFGVGPSDFTAAIAWGDGTMTPITTVIATPSGFTVLGTHFYASAGNYTFRVQVTDSQSRKALTSGTATVTVS
jgi:hypothetical protein